LVLAHDVHGAQHERTVVLLHSLGLDRTVWRSFVEPLSRHRAVVTVDLRGHGASPSGLAPDDDGFTIEEMADDVAATLDALGRPRTAVVGLSMGGCVAQAFVTRHPDRAEALGLIDTTAWYGPDAPRDWEQRATKAREEGMRSLSQFQLTRWFSDEFRLANEALGRELLDIFAGNDLAAYVSACRAMGRVDLRQAIAGVTVPTVIVVGEDDPATPPAYAQDMGARIPDSAVHVVPRTRHLTPMENPAAVLEHLEPLLA
jgi:3-oxoadipate enol-lactonase